MNPPTKPSDVMSHYGFKRISLANLLNHDEHPSYPSRLQGEKWIRACLKPQLEPSVPEEVVLLFEVARGSMVYGMFFLPLAALATEESFRVLEAGVRHRCEQLDLLKNKSGKPNAFPDKPYADMIAALHKAGVIPKDDLDFWKSMIFLRNRFSHTTSPTFRERHEAVGQLAHIAELLNRLFKSSIKRSSPPLSREFSGTNSQGLLGIAKESLARFLIFFERSHLLATYLPIEAHFGESPATFMPAPTKNSSESPVSFIEPDSTAAVPETGIALCLSGGGYRAMVFHLGALIRLNEVGLLPKLKRVSSVSGGSITAGLLGLRWKSLGWNDKGIATRLESEVVAPIRALAGKTIDAESIISGILLPGSISDKVAKAYDEYLFDGATLQNLPTDAEGPRFVINATSVQSGALWRFSMPYMADYLVGVVPNPTVPLSLAVAASSAFPPILSPVTLKLDPRSFTPDSACPLQKEPFTKEAILSDGGVYDNLGLETAWKRYQTILVSDGGGKLEPEPEPKHDWGRHSYRVLNVIDNQVRSLRKRQLIRGFVDDLDQHDGTYWGIRSHVKDYPITDALKCPPEVTLDLAKTPTRLKRLDTDRQERLINWGYAICDAALRAHCLTLFRDKHAVDVGQSPKFPYEIGL